MNAPLAELERQLGSPPPWIVGVLNITPDSFSDGGKFFEPKRAIEQAWQLKEDGAQLIDIGGEATGPGSIVVDSDEECRRLRPLLEAVAGQIFVSVDTYKSKTAAFCLSHGARMINDTSALRADEKLAEVVREFKAYLVLMYSKEQSGLPHVTKQDKTYTDIISEIADFFTERLAFATEHGILKEKIILDPGMGKYLSLQDKYSWELLKRFNELTQAFSQPFFIGTSRKGFLGGALEDRDALSQLTGLIAHTKGAHFIRTHNPKMAKQFFSVWADLVEKI